MPTCMAAADLVISRCGASALNELQNMGRGAILIPSPIVAENHQYHNGMVLEKAGAAIVIEQKDLTSEWLIRTVKYLCDNPSKLNELSENAKKSCISDTNERIVITSYSIHYTKLYETERLFYTQKKMLRKKQLLFQTL